MAWWKCIVKMAQLVPSGSRHGMLVGSCLMCGIWDEAGGGAVVDMVSGNADEDVDVNVELVLLG